MQQSPPKVSGVERAPNVRQCARRPLCPVAIYCIKPSHEMKKGGNRSTPAAATANMHTFVKRFLPPRLPCVWVNPRSIASDRRIKNQLGCRVVRNNLHFRHIPSAPSLSGSLVLIRMLWMGYIYVWLSPVGAKV